MFLPSLPPLPLPECLFQVDQEEQREEQERHAWEEMERGEEKARRVPQLLEKLSRPDQIPLYYCGGLQLLAQAITDCEYLIQTRRLPFEKSLSSLSLSCALSLLVSLSPFRCPLFLLQSLSFSVWLSFFSPCLLSLSPFSLCLSLQVTTAFPPT